MAASGLLKLIGTQASIMIMMNAFAGEASTLTVRVSPGWKTVPLAEM